MSDSKMLAALVILIFHNLFWLRGEYTMMTVCGKSKVCNDNGSNKLKFETSLLTQGELP